MPPFLVNFAQLHQDFRLPEIESLATLEGIPLKYDPATYSNESPFVTVELPSVADAQRLVRRAILGPDRDIVELWAEATSLPDLLAKIKEMPEQSNLYKTCSFKFMVQAFGSTISQADQVALIERFAFMGCEGPINLKDPDVTFVYFEDYGNHAEKGAPTPENPQRVFFGRLIASGNRKLVTKYDLKKREYLGITSMDAELSLVMANQALARSGSLIFDPFVGTGSFLVTCSHFGAYTMGADIDGRQIRGKDSKSIASNTKQYGLAGWVLDNVVSDIAHHPWREQPLWDAIVADPPYGVRAGAKKIGHNPKIKPPATALKANGEPRYPQTIPYEMSDVIVDLIDFAAKFLVPGGRLVYWLPTVTDEYKPEDVPGHPLFRLIANSEQNFGKWARRLITMEKIRGPPVVDNTGRRVAEGSYAPPSDPAHARFRERYFEKADGVRVVRTGED
ncbi:hypothetical protein HK104_000910 [Borealophlyctis nickersoniae]|nr:hypothetical protein HK104_000910 [Borealophlyctis nickersoniae]